MSDFTKAVTYLDYQKSRQATLAEATNAPTPFDKYYRTRKARSIKKLQTKLIIPAWTYVNGTQRYSGELLAQWNYILSRPFFILTPYLSNQNINGCLTIKYRVGSTVYRYALFGDQTLLIHEHNPPFWENLHVFPIYNNEIIKPNFCFEFWHSQPIGPVATPGLPNGYSIIISFLTNPSSPDQTELNISIGNPLLIANLGVNLPEALPYNQNNQAWLNNV